MFLKAKYGKENVWVNTDYIMDAVEDKNGKVWVYLVAEDRDGYEISRTDWLDFLALVNCYKVACEELPIEEISKITSAHYELK